MLATVKVTCQGFASAERIRFHWDSTSKTSFASAVADEQGSAVINIKIPVTPGGPHKLIGKGAVQGKTTTIAMSVRPSVSLSPKTGPRGTRVTVTFRGYRAGETITLVWYVSGTSTKTISKSIKAASNGTVKYTFSVPTGTAGGHKVEGRGSLKSKSSSTFTLTIVSSTAIDEPAPVNTPLPAPTRQPTLAPPPDSTPIPDSTPEPPVAPEPTAGAAQIP